MGFKDQFRSARRTSPDHADTHPAVDTRGVPRGRSVPKQEPTDIKDDVDLAGRLPKRSSSFGRSLGGLQSLTQGMAKVGESLSRKSTSDGISTPPMHTTPHTPSAMAPPPLPDSSHLAHFSLRLSELVNKAFVPSAGASNGSTPASGGALAGAAKSAAGIASATTSQGVPAYSSIVYDGKRLPNKGTVVEIATTVVAELDYAASVDAYLLRAVSRQALKALTIFADRIDSLVVTPSKDASASTVPASLKEGLHPPVSVEFNLALISLEWIVEDALERCIEGPPGTTEQGMPSFVSEILTPVRKKMEATILHVVQPLFSSIKSSLTSALSKSVPAPFAGINHTLSPISTTITPVPSAGSSLPVTSPGAVSPPGGIPSSSWSKEVEAKLEGARKLLIPRIVERCGQDGEGWFISIAIHFIWKGLLILTSRSMPLSASLAARWPSGLVATAPHLYASEISKRSPSPAQLSSALKSVSSVTRARKSTDPTRSSPTGAATPTSSYTPAGATALLSNASMRATNTQIADLQALDAMARKFASGFFSRANTQGVRSREEEDSSSESEDEEDELARAALAEALQAIRSTMTVVQYLEMNPEGILQAIAPSRGRSRNANGHALPPDVTRAARAIPPLLLLHLVYARMPMSLGVFASQADLSSHPIVAPPPTIFGLSWVEYEQAITGFAGGQSWASALVNEWRQDIEEAWTSIRARQNTDDTNPGHMTPCIDAAQLTSSPSVVEKSDPLDPADATPTPESHLLRRTVSTATSAGRSSDSLPPEMTQSAPTLDREKEIASKESVSQTKKANDHIKERSAWNMLRKASQSPAHSTNASPDTSPPRTPNSPSMQAGVTSEAAKTTPRSRFWRTTSSHATGGSETPRGFYLPGRKEKQPKESFSSGTPGTPVQGSATFSEHDLLRDELNLEMDSLKLLAQTLDVIKPQPSHNASVPS